MAGPVLQSTVQGFLQSRTTSDDGFCREIQPDQCQGSPDILHRYHIGMSRHAIMFRTDYYVFRSDSTYSSPSSPEIVILLF